MKTNWRERFEEDFGSGSFVGTGITRLTDVEAFIETLLEEVIEEAKAHFLDDYGMAEHLRAKWLTKD